MKKGRFNPIIAFIVVLVLSVVFYIISNISVAEAFAQYKTYAEKYLEESKLRNKYNEVRGPVIWKGNNQYIRDMLKGYSISSTNSKPVSNYIPRSNKFIY